LQLITNGFLLSLEYSDYHDVLSTTLTHKNRSYVNVNRFSQLLNPRQLLCSEADPDNLTALTLAFGSTSAFLDAKDLWNPLSHEGMLFTVADVSCSNGADEYAVYKYVCVPNFGSTVTKLY
jgi:hypothetical protein